ncbi:hypothetical protein Tco_0671262 [Tanacetum coccineum]
MCEETVEKVRNCVKYVKTSKPIEDYLPGLKQQLQMVEIVNSLQSKGFLEFCFVLIRRILFSSSMGSFRSKDGILESKSSIRDCGSKNDRSITGYELMIQGCAVSWEAMLQHITVLLTIKVVYMALTKAVKETIWLKGLWGEIGV